MIGMVFNIQKFSIHDGPGIRTTVFFKGCSLNCFWCHNPESIRPIPEIEISPEKCIGCGKCFKVCPVKAHEIIDGQRVFSRGKCTGCGKCAKVCYTGALVLIGKVMTVENVMNEVEKDRLFYENSGGGVTFSGGEPLLQKEFLKELLAESKKRLLHTAVETAGNVSWETFACIMPYTDLFLFDIKVMDEEMHRKIVGAGNSLIHGNLERLSKSGKEIWIRIPVITGVNDTVMEIDRISDFIKGLNNVKSVNLLPFHNLGNDKYERLGLEYKAKGYSAPSSRKMELLVSIIKRKGLPVKNSGKIEEVPIKDNSSPEELPE